ncbi:MAG: AgmX/PglI C-terminal domain-containing protein [Pseudomonadota bacterium]
MNNRNAYAEKKRSEIIGTDSKDTSAECAIIQVFIFREEVHLGWDCFHQEKVSIGSSDQADLVLKGPDIADIHARVCLKNNQVAVISGNPNGSVLVNNQAVEEAILGRFDYLDIGPYTIKIKILESKKPELKHEKKISRNRIVSIRKDPSKLSDPDENDHHAVNERKCLVKSDVLESKISDKRQNNGDGKFRVVYQGEVSEQYTAEEVRENLKKILGAEGRKFSWIDSKVPVVVKKELSQWDALKLCALFEKAGAKASIEKIEERPMEDPSGGDIPEPVLPAEPAGRSAIQKQDHDADEDDEEPDREALFALKDIILNENHHSSDHHPEVNLEVTKFRNHTIVDIFFLKPGNQYHIRSRDQKFLLAENDRKGAGFFYFSDHVWGTIQTKTAEAVKTDCLKKPEHVYRKQIGFYKHPVHSGDTVTITDGIFEYMIRSVYAAKSPEIPVPEIEEKIFHQYMIKSAIVHLFFLVFIGFFHSVKPPEVLPPETHFVKIDTSELSRIAKKKQPVLPPVVKPRKQESKAAPKEVVQKAVPKEEVRKTEKKASAVALKQTGQNRKPSVSRSPKAGGGFGEGNISNRNINQAGLLSMLGDSVGIKPQTAMAAVTNLDAVPSVHSGSAGFKVGGIVGKLGNARIEIPQAGFVSTKGSSQVLRSAGVGGEGTVAALEKGQTGQKQVQGMVSAQLTKAVGVQGGMSREAVKKVIDQHLDEISYCYETALIANPSIMGKVIFEWKILASGKVGMVSIKSSSINSNEIHACIKAAIQTWQFPAPKGSEVIVSYPFVFDIVGF